MFREMREIAVCGEDGSDGALPCKLGRRDMLIKGMTAQEIRASAAR
jgi:hypothetical protein